MLKFGSVVSRLMGRQRTIVVSSVSFAKRFYNNFYEPPYLDSLKPPIPLYDEINVQIKGYDYAVLENFQSFIHKIAMIMDINVDDSWATPAVSQKVQRFKPNGTVIDSEYNLKIYERNVGLVDVPSTTIALFVQAVQAALPQGVALSVHERTPEHVSIRYIPDLELKQLKDQLETVISNKKK